MKQKFYKCAHCGNIIEKIEDKGVPVVCCGEAMQELVPGTVDAAVEKHVPVYSVEASQVKVSVGSVEQRHTAQAPETGRKAGGLFRARSRRCSGSSLRILQSAWTVGSVKLSSKTEQNRPESS